MRYHSIPLFIATSTLVALAACSAPPASPPRSASEPKPAVAAATRAAETTARTAAPPPVSAEHVDAIAREVLRAQYPEGFDTKHGCWKAHYGIGDEAVPYCLRPLPPSLVAEAGKNVIYVAAASAADIEGDTDYRYGATDPGIFDAFRIELEADGAPTVTSVGKGMDFGSAGDCGCADADFVQLGPNVHGWVFTSGGMQQGVTWSTHSVIAPVRAAFTDVAGFPEYVEEDPELEYRLAIASEHQSGGWFPLTVSKYRSGHKAGVQTLRFDASTGRFPKPTIP